MSFFRLAVMLAGLAAIHLPLSGTPPKHSAHAALSLVDRHLAYSATSRVARGRMSAVRWLRRQPAVRRASLTGRTVDISFRDGADLLVLPRTSAAGPREPGFHTQMTHVRQSSGTARALVLEPFADELGLGADAGQQEADLLSKAGFTVDILRNSAVTVQVMETLSNYSVIYMETHSDPLAGGGDAVVTTGEVDDGTNSGLFSDGSLRQVSVAGDPNHIYDAITGTFISKHLGTFPNSSIMFVNGCGVRSAPLFWKALQSQNVAAFIGWDSDVPSSINVEAGNFVMTQLVSSSTVADSVATAIQEGLGIGISANGAARLGFLGDGFDTLAAARTGATPPSMPPPTTAPSATPTPPPTARPSTVTPRPAVATVRPAARARSCGAGRHRVEGKCRPTKPKHRKPHSGTTAGSSWPGEVVPGLPARMQ